MPPRPTRPPQFPQEAYDALVKADLNAVHIPEAYGGQGADAIATAIVIEEVARACASTALILAVNKLGTVPLMLAGSEELKHRYLPNRSPEARRCSPTRCRSPRPDRTPRR